MGERARLAAAARECMEMKTKTRRKSKTQLDELRAFYKAGKAVISSLDVDEVLQMISEEAVDIMKVDVCSLRLLDEKKENLILKATCGHTDEYKEKKRVMKVKGSIGGKVVKTKEPVSIGNVQKDPLYRYRSLARKGGLVSLLAVPLIQRGNVIGVINVYTPESHTFTRREVRLLSMFAEQAAIAIENARLFNEIHQNYLNTVKALGAVIDARDDYTRGHSEAVMKYGTTIAEKMNLPVKEVELVRFAGFLHDIGKVGVNLSILNKLGPLTQKEWKDITRHPIIGSDIVKQLGFLNELVPVILHHHERYDGGGYPAGLEKGGIPLACRILCVADAFDAMVSDRPYRSRRYTRKKAMKQLENNSGVQFDPKVVSVFLGILEEEKE